MFPLNINKQALRTYSHRVLFSKLNFFLCFSDMDQNGRNVQNQRTGQKNRKRQTKSHPNKFDQTQKPKSTIKFNPKSTSKNQKLQDPKPDSKIKLFHPTHFTRDANVILVQQKTSLEDNKNNETISRIAAHSMILNQIPYFESFFSMNWQTDSKSYARNDDLGPKRSKIDGLLTPTEFTVNIPFASSSTFCSYIKLIYDKVNQNEAEYTFEQICEFYKLADFFNDSEQIEAFSGIIKDKIDVTNLMRVYSLGQDLKQDCVRFIHSMKDSEFKKLLQIFSSESNNYEIQNNHLIEFFSIFGLTPSKVTQYSQKRKNLLMIAWLDCNKRHENFEDVFAGMNFGIISEILGYRLIAMVHDANFPTGKADYYTRMIVEKRNKTPKPTKTIEATVLDQFEFCMNHSLPKHSKLGEWSKFPKSVTKNCSEIIYIKESNLEDGVNDKSERVKKYDLKRFANPKFKEKTKKKNQKKLLRKRVIVEGEVNSLVNMFKNSQDLAEVDDVREEVDHPYVPVDPVFEGFNGIIAPEGVVDYNLTEDDDDFF